MEEVIYLLKDFYSIDIISLEYWRSIMPISNELLEILACPIDKKDVEYKKSEDFLQCKKCDLRFLAERVKDKDKCPKCGEKVEKIKGEVLVCTSCRRWYPIIDDIPHMLPDELRDDLV